MPESLSIVGNGMRWEKARHRSYDQECKCQKYKQSITNGHVHSFYFIRFISIIDEGKNSIQLNCQRTPFDELSTTKEV